MSRDSVLARGRAAAQAGMVDACTIVRQAISSTNEETGEPSFSNTTLYTGACRVQQRVPGGARPADVGEAYKLMLRLELQLPMVGTSGIQPGDRVTVTVSVHDPDLVGKVLLIRELAHKTHATARRFGVEEVT